METAVWKRVCRSIVLCLVGICLVTGTGWAVTYEVGGFEYPPFSIVKSSTKIEGILINLASQVLNRAGIVYEMHGYSVKRLYQNLAEGKTHIFIGTKGVPEYDDIVLYSRNVVSELELRAYAIGETPLPQSVQDLTGKTVITIFGYGYGGLINFIEDPQNNIKVTPAKSHHTAFAQLEAHRGDYVLDYRRPAEMLPKTKSIEGLKYATLSNIKLYFIVSKNAPQAEDAIKRIDAAYEALDKEGVIDKIWSSVIY